LTMAKTRVIDCPECNSKIRLSVRSNGEVTALESERADPLEDLERV